MKSPWGQGFVVDCCSNDLQFAPQYWYLRGVPPYTGSELDHVTCAMEQRLVKVASISSIPASQNMLGD